MFKTIRFVFGIVLILIVALICLRFVLGDDFQAWINAGKVAIKNPLEDMVSKYQLKYEKAKIKVEEASETAKKIHVQVSKQRAAVATLERHIVEGRSAIIIRKQELGLIKDKLDQGQPVFFVSGSEAKADDLREHIESREQEIEIAEEKLGLIDPILQLRRKKLSQLESLKKTAPSSIRRLQASLKLLKTKLDMYKGVKTIWDEEASGQSTMDDLFAEASKALKDAHYKLDNKLAEFDAMVDMSIDLSEELDPGSSEGVEIREMLDGIIGKNVHKLSIQR